METTNIQNQKLENLNGFFKKMMLSYLKTHEDELSAEMLVHLMQINLGFCKLNEFAFSCLASVAKETCQFSYCPKEVQPALECLIKLLIPQQIYLVKHENSSTKDSYGYNLYIIVPERPGRKLVHLQPYLDLTGLSAVEMTCSVFTWAKVKDGLAKGQLFFLLYFNKKHLVYDDGSLSIPILGLSELILAKEKMQDSTLPFYFAVKHFLKKYGPV